MTDANSIGAGRDISDVRMLVDTIRTAQLESVRTLTNALIRLDVPGMLPIMVDLLTDENPDVSLAAYDWLARASDERALTILTSKLEDTGSSANDKWLAAEALGRRGNAAAVASIRRVAEGFVQPTRDALAMRDRLVAAKPDDGVARLLVRLAITEAELGGDELAAIPVVFAREEAGRDPIVRIEAVNALASVAAEGMLDVLRNALLAENDEVAEGAIWALRLLGAREAVDLLVGVAAPARPDLAEIALTAVVAVTGPGPGMGGSVFDLAPDALSLWWRAARAGFLSGVCYRWGKLLSVATLVELLRDPKQRAIVADELRIVTGFDCGFDVNVPAEQQDSVVATAEHWLGAAGSKYRTGALYKYGHERNLSEAVRTGVFVGD